MSAVVTGFISPDTYGGHFVMQIVLLLEIAQAANKLTKQILQGILPENICFF